MFNKSNKSATPSGGGTGASGASGSSGASGASGASSTFGQQNAGFGATNSFGTSAIGTTTNSGGVFGSTQNKPGGLFGSTNFSQPVTSSTSAGFGFGAASGAPSLFGNTGGRAGGGLFSQPNNAFSANKPTSFGSFGTSTSSGGGGLFGAANATSNPFGGGASSRFGGSGFTSTQQQQQQKQQQQPGTTVKFNPPSGSDTMVNAGVPTSIDTNHQCITAMKEYENKSLEELRLEDYQAGRKGPSNPMAAGTRSLFGAATSSASTGLFGAAAPNAGFSFRQNKSTFGAGAPGGFGTTSGSLFDQNQPSNASCFKPFGQTSTTQSSGFSFGNTNTIGQANTSSMGLFGNTAASQAGGLFGAAQTSTASGFGAATGLSGQTNPGFGNTGTQVQSHVQVCLGIKVLGLAPPPPAPPPLVPDCLETSLLSPWERETTRLLLRLKPTNPTAQKALTTPTHYKLTQSPAHLLLLHRQSEEVEPQSEEVEPQGDAPPAALRCPSSTSTPSVSPSHRAEPLPAPRTPSTSTCTELLVWR